SSPSQGIISVVDMNTKSESKKITFDKIYQLTRLELSPSKDKLYVLATGSGKMFVIDTNTDEVISNFDIAIMTSDFKVDSISGNIIVLDNMRIGILNPAGALIREHKFVKGDFYEKLILDSNNTTAYVTHSVDPIMLKVNLNTNDETTVTLKERARDIISDNIKQLVYVLYDSSLAILKNDTLESYKPEVSTGGQKGVSLFRFKDQIYIVNMNSSNLSTFDINTLEMKKDLIPAVQSPKKILVF
ncbi:MAG: YncE family protein, partial [Candidatus Sericytochromatia bacterium]